MRRSIQLTTISLLILSVFAMGLVAAPVSAQEQPSNESVSDDKDPGNETDSSSSDDKDPAREIEHQLGRLDVHSVEWEESGVVLEVTWRGNTPTTISTTEMIDPGSSVQRIGIDQTRVLPGDRTEIRVDLSAEYGGVIVTTSESIERQEALPLTPSGGDLPYVGFQWGIGLGIALGGVGVSFAGYRKMKSTSSVERAPDSSGGGPL